MSNKPTACQALGINYTSQLERLQNDPILGDSTVPLRGIVGADGKEREMQTIPFKFVFGWLFRIDSRNVKEEARETVLKYQLECYNALYNHFAEMDEYLRERNQMIEASLSEMEIYRENFKQAKSLLDDAKVRLNQTRAITFEKWRADKAQMEIDFPLEKASELPDKEQLTDSQT